MKCFDIVYEKKGWFLRVLNHQFQRKKLMAIISGVIENPHTFKKSLTLISAALVWKFGRLTVKSGYVTFLSAITLML